MLPIEVREKVHRGEKEGRISYWLQPTSCDEDESRENWDRIEHGDGVNRIKEYENGKAWLNFIRGSTSVFRSLYRWWSKY